MIRHFLERRWRDVAYDVAIIGRQTVVRGRLARLGRCCLLVFHYPQDVIFRKLGSSKFYSEIYMPHQWLECER